MNVGDEISCWNCGYQIIGGITFLGKCSWFSVVKNANNKDIPPQVVDVGCKYFTKREKPLLPDAQETQETIEA